MKHANTSLLAAACAAVFSLTLQMPGADDTPETGRASWEDDISEAETAIWTAVFRNIEEKGRDALLELIRLMDRTDPGSPYLGGAFSWIDRTDGMDFLARGDPDLLASVRDILPRLMDHIRRHETMTRARGIFYLAKKGDLRDFSLFEDYLADPVFRQRQSEMSRDDQGGPRDLSAWLSIPYRILQHRVAGTNIVMGSFDRKLYPYFNPSEYDHHSYTTNRLRFIPSVANTGPQAAYVYEAFEQAHALGRRLGCDTPHSSITNIAPELLTMRVWFDADGEAVCDVDLAKHGIFVPGLRTAGPNTPAPPLRERVSPAITVGAGDANTAAASGTVTAPPPRSRPAVPLAFAAGVLAALGALAALRKTHRQ